jgi:hypothetical protein
MGERGPQVSEHIERRPVAAASRGSARRHRVEGGRHRELKLRFTDDEYDAIIVRAADAKVSVHRYMADGALAGRAAANNALIAELTGLRRLVANLANNTNQIARRLNAGGYPDGGVTANSDALRRLIQRMDIALARAGAPRPATLTNRNTHPRRPESRGT